MSSKIAWNTRESLSQKVGNVDIGETAKAEKVSIVPSAAGKNSGLQACPFGLLIGPIASAVMPEIRKLGSL